MGAHHLADVEATRLARVAGHGALVASTALALTGSGAGLALAHTDHDAGDGHGSGHDSEHPTASSAGTTCDTEHAGQASESLLGDLGLTASPEELCAAPASTDGGSTPTGYAEGQAQSPTPAQSTDTGSSAPATAAAPATPTNPDDIPPAPGETKYIDLPDQPSGHSGRT